MRGAGINEQMYIQHTYVVYNMYMYLKGSMVGYSIPLYTTRDRLQVHVHVQVICTPLPSVNKTTARHYLCNQRESGKKDNQIIIPCINPFVFAGMKEKCTGMYMYVHGWNVPTPPLT